MTENSPILCSTMINITLLAKLLNPENRELAFLSSIDEIGRIVLTPTTLDIEFVDVIVLTEEETNSNSEYITLNIQANICKATDIFSITADVDEIGQCLISISPAENVFVSASINDSLNLVTEDAEEEPKQVEPENVSSEVINEETVLKSLKDLTNNFTDKQGQLECDTSEEKELCVKTLLEFDYNVTTNANDMTVLYESCDACENIR